MMSLGTRTRSPVVHCRCGTFARYHVGGTFARRYHLGGTFARFRGIALGLAIAALVLSSARAGSYNPTLSIGDVAPAWKDLPGVDGKTHSLADLSKAEVVVVVFTCNSCPYAVDYEDRLNAFDRANKEHRKSVALVAINVNTIAEDALPAMKQRAEEKGFTFPYLFDASQKIAKEYGAARTPEFFVLNKDRKVVYMGSMDDSSDAAKVSKHYVDDAVKAAIAGTAADPAETPPVGCAVRYERERRRRAKANP